MERWLAIAGCVAMALAVSPVQVSAQDFERPGIYLSGSWSHLGEQFGDDLNDEIEAALELDNPRLSVGDSDVWSATLGVRLGSRVAIELVGESYDDLPIDLTLGGTKFSGDLELWSGMVMGKLFLFPGRIQPYVIAGAGYLQGRLEFGDIDETGHAALGRAGAGVDVYLTPNLAVGVQAAYSRALGSDFEDLAFFTAGTSLMLRF